MPTIAIMTDFGIKDGNVGVMKGVIWGICPDANIADLSHLITHQNIAEAALILFRSAAYFPPQTVHLVVVDPGVGTARRPLAARIGDWYYVGPDNGTITMLVQHAQAQGWPIEFLALDQPRFWLPNVSHVFHGRDIFAPCAAHLAAGVPLKELGTPISDPVLIDLPKPRREGDVWHGELIHIDHFGNLASNIREEHLADWLPQRSRIKVEVNGSSIDGLVNTFGERPESDLVALIGSTGNLIVSVVNGDAAGRLGAHVGDQITAELRR